MRFFFLIRWVVGEEYFIEVWEEWSGVEWSGVEWSGVEWSEGK